MGAGRPRAFKNPLELLKYFESYKVWANNNPTQETVYNQKLNKQNTIYKKRPYSKQGFEMFLNKNKIIKSIFI